jgi:hypothetical protein
MRVTEDVRQPHAYRTGSSNSSVSVPLYKLAGPETSFLRTKKEEEIRQRLSLPSGAPRVGVGPGVAATLLASLTHHIVGKCRGTRTDVEARRRLQVQ